MPYQTKAEAEAAVANLTIGLRAIIHTARSATPGESDRPKDKQQALNEIVGVALMVLRGEHPSSLADFFGDGAT